MATYVIWLVILGAFPESKAIGAYTDEVSCVQKATEITVAMHGRGHAFCVRTGG